jgi:tRNA (guanine37-N1)-methyltransferase
MQFDVVTLFPKCLPPDAVGWTRRAFEQNKCGLSLWNPRDFTTDNHRTVDDRPYGGGPGMVMLAKPLEATPPSSARPMPVCRRRAWCSCRRRASR